MVIAAMAFVFIYICLHTLSFPLACLAMLQILLSIRAGTDSNSPPLHASDILMLTHTIVS